ncbi:cytochrome c [Rhodanobacter sp. DHB23]|uniref:c-type cytochrome n=1 Tax=Rhodanobacter sp. DHB23 TaxID=2775923 RepID=UPI00177C6917|nr:cytochrome c [Rhodanobacter sp. DHB23]MBD8873142.1 cytochrome c [Rhodanobacter sp. DHB23]
MKWLLRVLSIAILLALVLLACWLLRPLGQVPVPRSASAVGEASLRDPALIARGAALAAAGDCAACHTAQGGVPYAGGRLLPTPFGNIATGNLTPDPATGLGDWSFEDFWQALHSGIGRQREPLYPAFPYTSYTRLTRDDALAIYAYLQSLPPVHRTDTPDELAFPYSVRRLLVAWRALYFREGTYQPDPQRTATWNRGAYLVQGLAHCNECHAPRNALGAVLPDRFLAGGEIPAQHWYAPDLSTQAHGGLAGWSAQDIVDLLKTGQSARGAAFGPMADVVRQSTQHIGDDDLHAIADYLSALPARASPLAPPAPPGADQLVQQGKDVYRQRCADCHGADGRGVPGIYPPLDGNVSVIEPGAINAIRMVLLGGFAPGTVANPRPYSMPPYAQQLDDTEVAAVVSYIRHAWGNRAGAVSPQDVGRYRHTPED